MQLSNPANDQSGQAVHMAIGRRCQPGKLRMKWFLTFQQLWLNVFHVCLAQNVDLVPHSENRGRKQLWSFNPRGYTGRDSDCRV